ncbi:hypothetical protein ACODT3_17885 [Streptomyces sp. 4.24]|uniref:hypothetical protein n=1 Tax=Streptomyces tritrimontium TaxID=3406573 RepID=UPI003BB74B51
MTDGDTADEAGRAGTGDPAQAPPAPAAPPAAPAPPAPAEPAERVHWLQRSMAGVAALLAAVPVGLAVVLPAALAFLLPFAAVAVPLFLRDPRAFRTTCQGVGTVLTVFGVLMACFGAFAVIPSGVILLLAAVADPRRRPVLARVLAVVTAAAAIALLTAVAPVARDVLRPVYAYSVEISGPFGEKGLETPVLWEYGVTGTSQATLESGTRLEVTYDPDLTEAERAALREHLARIPGAGPVKTCNRRGCD